MFLIEQISTAISSSPGFLVRLIGARPWQSADFISLIGGFMLFADPEGQSECRDL